MCTLDQKKVCCTTTQEYRMKHVILMTHDLGMSFHLPLFKTECYEFFFFFRMCLILLIRSPIDWFGFGSLLM